MIYEQFGDLKFKYRNREFWCRGYYVDTVGKNKNKIQEYIKHQLDEDKLGDQLSLPYPGSPFIYLSDYDGSDYDDYMLYAASGPRVLFTGGELSLQPTFTKRWTRNKRYSQSWGLRLDGQKSFSRLIVGAGVSGARNSYADPYVDDLLRGNEYGAYVAPRLIVSNQCYVQAELAYTRNGARNPSYAYDSWRYSLGGYYFFKYGFSLSLNYSITRDSYREERYFIAKDHYIDEARRKDSTRAFTAELATNVFERYGITPSLQYSYTQRKSNIWSNEYDKHRLNMAFELSF